MLVVLTYFKSTYVFDYLQHLSTTLFLISITPLSMFHLHHNLQQLQPSNFSMTFKDSIWKDDILLNTNAKTNTLCFFIQMKCKWENFKLKNLLMFEDLT